MRVPHVMDVLHSLSYFSRFLYGSDDKFSETIYCMRAVLTPEQLQKLRFGRDKFHRELPLSGHDNQTKGLTILLWSSWHHEIFIINALVLRIACEL